MPRTQNVLPANVWSEPAPPEPKGLIGAGWLPEIVCGMALLPLVAMALGVVTIPAAVAALAGAGTLGVGALALG